MAGDDDQPPPVHAVIAPWLEARPLDGP
jgi:hypothetical protein